MIPVALPTYNRPEYLKQTLAWLEANKYANNILLVTSEEPYKPCQELISRSNLAKERIVNNKRKGLSANVCQAITAASEKADWFVCVEDDVLIGYDSLEMSKWAFEKENATIVNFENALGGVGDRDFALLKDNWFHCHGWACRSCVWQNFMKTFDTLKNPHQSWANPFNYFLSISLAPIHLFLTPELSRTYYIGKYGQFSNAEKFKNHVCGRWIEMDIPRFYSIQGERNSAPSKEYIVNECKEKYEQSKK